MTSRDCVVRAFFSAIDACDWEGALQYVTPDFTCLVTPNSLVSELRLEGRERLREWLGAASEGHQVRHALEQVVHRGDQTVVLAQITTGYAGQAVQTPCVNVMRFHGGLIAENVMVISD